jgi:hypothetical protein
MASPIGGFIGEKMAIVSLAHGNVSIVSCLAAVHCIFCVPPTGVNNN